MTQYILIYFCNSINISKACNQYACKLSRNCIHQYQWISSATQHHYVSKPSTPILHQIEIRLSSASPASIALHRGSTVRHRGSENIDKWITVIREPEYEAKSRITYIVGRISKPLRMRQRNYNSGLNFHSLIVSCSECLLLTKSLLCSAKAFIHTDPILMIRGLVITMVSIVRLRLEETWITLWARL